MVIHSFINEKEGGGEGGRECFVKHRKSQEKTLHKIQSSSAGV